MKIIRSAGAGPSAAEPAAEPPGSAPRRTWKVLVVDDEPDVRSLTRLNLQGFRFAERELEFLEAGSAYEARAILERTPDVAVALIDVVMETDDAGLRLVEHIRRERGNHLLRIVIRTGQPGVAPERYVIDHFDIDDYKDKTELTAQRLYTTMRTALKAYRDLKTIDLNRHGLAKILDAAPEIYRIAIRSINEFFQGVLTQVIGLCRLEESSCIATIDGLVATFDGQEITVQAKSDSFPAERFEEIRRLCSEAVLTGSRPAGLPGHSLVVPLDARGRPVGFIYVEPTLALSDSDRDLIRIMAHQCSMALENLRMHMNIVASHDHAIDMLAAVAEFKDQATGEHIHRIDAYTRLVAVELGVPPDEADIWGKASRLHDVGKVGIPDGILGKPGQLSSEEFEVIKRHTELGAAILAHDAFFETAREVAYSHHERWDGTGYPEGRPARELSLLTRIVSVVDVFDAIVSHRPYKEAWPADRAVAVIEEGAGTQFDPTVVQAFVALYRRGEFDAILAGATEDARRQPI